MLLNLSFYRHNRLYINSVTGENVYNKETALVGWVVKNIKDMEQT